MPSDMHGTVMPQKIKPVLKKVEPKIKLKPKLKPQLKPKLRQLQHQHNAIISTCTCGSFKVSDRMIGKQFPDRDQGRKEYELWQFVQREIGVRAERYFSLPIDIHECSDNYVLTFNNDGYDLSSDLIQSKITGSQRFEMLKKIFYHIAQGLELLNGIGVIHLDIKPENIVVDPITLLPKIIDIGNGQKINSILKLKPSINIVNKTIHTPEYRYYPPHKFYFEDWIEDASNCDLITVCNLASDYCSAHRIMIRDVLLDDVRRLELIGFYQRDDPRTKILKITKNAEKLYDYQRVELNKWDVYGLGITILETIKIDANVDNIWYDRLLDNGLKMISPDACKRISFNNLIDTLS